MAINTTAYIRPTSYGWLVVREDGSKTEVATYDEATELLYEKED